MHLIQHFFGNEKNFISKKNLQVWDRPNIKSVLKIWQNRSFESPCSMYIVVYELGVRSLFKYFQPWKTL